MKHERYIFEYHVSDDITYSEKITLPLVFVDAGDKTAENAVATFKIKSLDALKTFIGGGDHKFYFQGHHLDVTDFWKPTDVKKSIFYKSWVDEGLVVEIGKETFLLEEPTFIKIDDYFKNVEMEAMIR